MAIPARSAGSSAVLDRLDQRQRDVDERPGSGLTNIAASPIVLTRRTGGDVDLGRQLGETAGDAAELLDLDLAAEPREPDQIGEADRELLRVRELAGLELGAAEHAAADALAQVRPLNAATSTGVSAGVSCSASAAKRSATSSSLSPGLQERVDERRRDRRGEPRHPLAEDTR